MLYIVFTCISALFLALYDFFKKVSVRSKKDIYDILFFYTFTAFACSLIFTKNAINTDLKYIGFTFIKASVISLSWFLTMKAVTKLDLGIVTPFSMLGTIFTTIFAWIFFHQKIGLIQIGGSLIILLGLILISRLSSKKEGFKNDYRYLLLLVVAAFLSSISAMIDKSVLGNGVDKGALLFWFFFFLASIYFIVCLLRNKKISINNLKTNLWVIAVGFSIFLADFFYYQAVAIDNVSLSMISIIRKLSSFIAVVLAGIFLKEDNLVKKIMILLLMFVGLAFIIFI